MKDKKQKQKEDQITYDIQQQQGRKVIIIQNPGIHCNYFRHKTIFSNHYEIAIKSNFLFGSELPKSQLLSKFNWKVFLNNGFGLFCVNGEKALGPEFPGRWHYDSVR